MVYVIRDVNTGLTKAIIPQGLGDELIANVPGTWGTVYYEGEATPRYTLKKTQTMTISDGRDNEMTLFIWEGDTLDRRPS